jgi:hypothetical protein
VTPPPSAVSAWHGLGGGGGDAALQPITPRATTETTTEEIDS